MNRPSDIDAWLAAWVEQGPSGGPGEVLSQALAHALSTHQDRGWLDRLTHPMRFQLMHAMLKIAAVAIVALAVGVVLDPLRPSTPYAATGPSPSPSPSPIPLLPLVDGNLEAGTTYVIDYGAALPAYPRIVFTVPAAGWLSYNDGNVGKPDHNPLMTPWTARNLMNDPCHSLTGGEFDPPVGPTIDDLATALVQQGAGTASAPTDVTVGGYAAKRLELSLPAGLDIATCEGQEGGTFGRWAESTFTGGHLWANGQRNILYIVDVDGFRTLIDTVYEPGTTEADLAEAEELVASMRFEPVASATARPSSSP